MVHPDLDELLNAVIPFAQQTLVNHGEFYPFGASVAPDGTVAMESADMGEEHPQSQELIDMLTEGFRRSARAGQIRAACICYDARTIPPGETEKTDAICIAMEHESGDSVDVFLQYSKDSRGNISYGELFGGQRERQFFVT
jgi:hypothetical protein